MSHADGRVHVVIEGPQGEEQIDGSDLLVATGRKPNVDGLALEAAGIGYGAGGIVVTKGLRTTNRKVYAIGDAAGGHFTHEANHHAGIVIRNALFRLPAKADENAIPWVTFTDPELAHVGLTEAQAREQHKVIRVLRWPYHENDRAQTERQTHGHIKVITAKNGRILGATIVGAQAGELITTWTLGALARAQYPRHDRHCGAVSDIVRNREARGDRIFFVKFEQSARATRDPLPAPVRVRYTNLTNDG